MSARRTGRPKEPTSEPAIPWLGNLSLSSDRDSKQSAARKTQDTGAGLSVTRKIFVVDSKEHTNGVDAEQRRVDAVFMAAFDDSAMMSIAAVVQSGGALCAGTGNDRQSGTLYRSLYTHDPLNDTMLMSQGRNWWQGLVSYQDLQCLEEPDRLGTGSSNSCSMLLGIQINDRLEQEAFWSVEMFQRLYNEDEMPDYLVSRSNTREDNNQNEILEFLYGAYAASSGIGPKIYAYWYFVEEAPKIPFLFPHIPWPMPTFPSWNMETTTFLTPGEARRGKATFKRNKTKLEVEGLLNETRNTRVSTTVMEVLHNGIDSALGNPAGKSSLLPNVDPDQVAEAFMDSLEIAAVKNLWMLDFQRGNIMAKLPKVDPTQIATGPTPVQVLFVDFDPKYTMVVPPSIGTEDGGELIKAHLLIHTIIFCGATRRHAGGDTREARDLFANTATDRLLKALNNKLTKLTGNTFDVVEDYLETTKVRIPGSTFLRSPREMVYHPDDREWKADQRSRYDIHLNHYLSLLNQMCRGRLTHWMVMYPNITSRLGSFGAYDAEPLMRLLIREVFVRDRDKNARLLAKW
ncbi:MAG: hypothetical protein ACKVI4_15485, partial [Actinomycetales bacterium]